MKGFSRSQRRLSSRRPDAIAEERNARERMSNNSYLNFDGVTSYMEIADARISVRPPQGH